jgi:NitT/TauT family transport system permease protein
MTVKPATAKPNEEVWKWGLRLGSLAAVAVVWEGLARYLDSMLLPTFFETVPALGELIISSELWQGIWISNQAMLIGFVASLVVGIPLGLLMGRMRTAEEVSDVYLNLVLAMPVAPLIPVIILALGLGLIPRALVVFIFTYVFVVVNTRVGLRNVDPGLIEMAHSFGATERQLWVRVLLPGALPAVMTGVRIGLGRAITGMVTVELLMIATGIGRLMLFFGDHFQAATLYGVVFVVVAEAVLLMEIAKRIEQRLIRWKTEVATV